MDEEKNGMSVLGTGDVGCSGGVLTLEGEG